jgi:hypothetical protein
MRFALSRTTAVGATVASVLALGGLVAASASAGVRPSTTYYSKNGSYQFASNYTDGSSTPFLVSNSPFGYSDAAQTLGATKGGPGVDLSVSGSPSYASSAVIVGLGKLDSLFSNGQFAPPVINGSGNLQYNLYFDTNANAEYFGWGTHDPYSYAGMDGDNAACMGAANNTSDNADFTCFPGETATAGGPALSGQMTMEQVQAAFEARTDGGTTNPEVWAWIGIQTSPDATGYVTSVNGIPLVKTSTNVVQNVHEVSKSATSIKISWDRLAGVDSYTIRVWKGSKEVKQAFVPGPPYNITGLTKSTSYQIYVRAGTNGPAGNGITVKTKS